MHGSVSSPAATAVAPSAATGSGATSAAALTPYRTEVHDRIALRLNDVVIQRIFAAGLDLHRAVGRVGDQRGAREICHALGDLDHAIRDIRDLVFDLGPPAR
jgi:signal transduction histidine kinase